MCVCVCVCACVRALAGERSLTYLMRPSPGFCVVVERESKV